jgi:hypothetical protein
MIYIRILRPGKNSMSRRAAHAAALALGACIPVAGSALADPDDYVSTPAVEYGEREIDFKYGVGTRNDEPSAQGASLGLGYGVTEWWFTEFYLKGTRLGARSGVDAIEFENKFQLTESGKYPIDVGFLAEFEFPHDRSEGNEFQFGPLFQAEFERLQLKFNPLLAAISRAGEGNGTYVRYQWQLRYRWREALDLGAQGFGDMGRWNHLSPAGEQSHRVGPAIFGKYSLGGHQAIVYNAALLFGVTSGAPDRNFRMQVEYEF